MKLLVAIAIFGAVLTATPASANHDMVYAPCDPEDTRSVDERVWYIDYQSGVILRYDDPWWSQKPGMGGYTNWHHQCRLGMTGVWQAAPILPQPHPPDYVIETRSNPAIACDAANGYTRMGAVEIGQRVDALISDGLNVDSLTITDTGIIIAGTPSPLLFEAGIIREYAIDHNGTSRHYLDPYWEYRFTHLPNETFWEAGCTIPPPATTTSTTTSTTTTLPPDSPPTSTTPSVPTTTVPPPPTTTVIESSAVEDSNTITEDAIALAPPSIVSPDSLPLSVDGYDLFSAQWEGYPFEQTILLLEERYPPNTPDKYHFRLSAAVEYLRLGGMVGGLDSIWNSGIVN